LKFVFDLIRESGELARMQATGKEARTSLPRRRFAIGGLCWMGIKKFVVHSRHDAKWLI
jgi:hypothetical protein